LELVEPRVNNLGSQILQVHWKWKSGSWKSEVGSGRVEIGSGRVEVEEWKLEVGS
jgi:hypothetical protein